MKENLTTTEINNLKLLKNLYTLKEKLKNQFILKKK